MAHKKAGGSSRNGRDSAGRRLGGEEYGGEVVTSGNILARQRGTSGGRGPAWGSAGHTIFAVAAGHVSFVKGFKGRTFISVLPPAGAAE